VFPPRFDYAAPTTLDEALELLRAHGDEAKPLAGGQSLIPLLKLRFAAPRLVVDLGRVPGLDQVHTDAGGLRLGALVRHNQLARAGLQDSGYGVIADAAPQIADPLVRNLGTLGGSLAHADPQGDWASVMLALRAAVVARSHDGERTIPLEELVTGPFTTALEPDEVLTEIRVPSTAARSGGTYLKLERRVGDFPTVAVAVHLELEDGTDRIARAGIALTAVGPRNLRADAAEQALAGAEPTEQAFAEAAELAAQAARPADDLRGSAEYKRAVVRTYVRRGLATAAAAARA
jgi:aerobic carbon-monoxide dehydrogenase medium subunit